jgi:multiple sugar transport system ATP-binding protein
LPISLGIRPENVVLGSGEGTATIRLVEPTGHESIVTLDIDGRAVITRAPGDTPLQIGETVRFSLRMDRLHFFDRATGVRLNSDLQA